MIKIKCPECSKVLDSATEACPECGQPLGLEERKLHLEERKLKREMSVGLASLLITIGLALVAGGQVLVAYLTYSSNKVLRGIEKNSADRRHGQALTLATRKHTHDSGLQVAKFILEGHEKFCATERLRKAVNRAAESIGEPGQTILLEFASECAAKASAAAVASAASKLEQDRLLREVEQRRMALTRVFIHYDREDRGRGGAGTRGSRARPASSAYGRSGPRSCAHAADTPSAWSPRIRGARGRLSSSARSVPSFASCGDGRAEDRPAPAEEIDVRGLASSTPASAETIDLREIGRGTGSCREAA
jgi:hypothetical protein